MTARAQKMPAARQVLDKAASEDGLLLAIVEAAGFLGWVVHHDRRSDLANPQWGTHPGFPDLVMSRRGVTIVAELKAAGENPTAAQFAWLHAMGYGIPQGGRVFRVYVWRPADLDAALAELARP